VISRAAVLCLLLTAGAAAGELDGIWVGQLPGRDGDVIDVSFRFTQNGTRLTGKLYGDTDSLPLREGKIEAGQISFRVSNEMNGGQTRFRFSGAVKNGTIELTRTRELRPEEVNDPNRRNVPQIIILKRLL
jgi:hypothetical protein